MIAVSKVTLRIFFLSFLVLIVQYSSQPTIYASSLNQSSQKDPVIWMKELNVNLNQMAIDHEDSVCMVVSFKGKLEFNNQTNEIHELPAANEDEPSTLYIIKLDSLGRLKWGSALETSGHVTFKDIKIDAMNSIYLSGTFEKRIVFNPQQSSSELTTKKQTAVFVCKFDKNGTCLWSRKWENDDYRSNEWDIAVDPDRNVYIAGAGWGGLDIDPGDGKAILPNSTTDYGSHVYTSFLCKLDREGNFIWFKSWDITDPNIPCFQDVEVDGKGHVYLTGAYEGVRDFDPNEGVNMKIGRSWIDIFLLILDNDGNFKNVLTFGGPEMEFPFGIRIDKENNVYLFGRFNDKVDFDPGTGVAYRRAARRDSHGYVFILKLDTNLKYKWVITWSEGDYNASEIFVDNYGNVYELACFDDYSTPEVEDWKSGHGYADYIRKYNKNGEFKGACRWFDDTKTGVLRMEVDSEGAFYVFGARPSPSLMKLSPLEFSTDVKVFADLPDKSADYKQLVESLQSDVKTIYDKIGSGWRIMSTNGLVISAKDIHVSADDQVYFLGRVFREDIALSAVDFLSKWDSDGKMCWVKVWEDHNLETSRVISDKKGNIYLTGLFTGTVDFDPGSDVYSVTSFNKRDYFICKFNCNADLQWVSMIAKKRGFTTPMLMAIDESSNLYLSSWADEDFYLNLKCDKPYDDPGIPVKANLIKVDPDGNILWIKRILPNESSGLGDIIVHIYDLTFDDRKGILLSGIFSGVKDTEQSEKKTKNESNRIINQFLTNLDLNGNCISTLIWSNSKYIHNLNAIHSPDGGFYITGTFIGEIDFHPDSGNSLVKPKKNLIKSLGAGSSFLMKISNNNELEWVKTWGPSQTWFARKLRFLNDNSITNFILNSPDDRYMWIIPEGDEYSMPHDMLINSDGEIFMSGLFKGIIDFNPDTKKVHEMLSCISRFKSRDWSEIGLTYDVATFLSKFNKHGYFQDAIRIPGTLEILSEKALAIDSQDNLYVILNPLGSEFGDWVIQIYPSMESEELKDVFLMKIPSTTFPSK